MRGRRGGQSSPGKDPNRRDAPGRPAGTCAPFSARGFWPLHLPSQQLRLPPPVGLFPRALPFSFSLVPSGDPFPRARCCLPVQRSPAPLSVPNPDRGRGERSWLAARLPGLRRRPAGWAGAERGRDLGKERRTPRPRAGTCAGKQTLKLWVLCRGWTSSGRGGKWQEGPRPREKSSFYFC